MSFQPPLKTPRLYYAPGGLAMQTAHELRVNSTGKLTARPEFEEYRLLPSMLDSDVREVGKRHDYFLRNQGYSGEGRNVRGAERWTRRGEAGRMEGSILPAQRYRAFASSVTAADSIRAFAWSVAPTGVLVQLRRQLLQRLLPRRARQLLRAASSVARRGDLRRVEAIAALELIEERARLARSSPATRTSAAPARSGSRSCTVFAASISFCEIRPLGSSS